MRGRVGLFTSGLWRKRVDIARLTGLAPVRRFRSARGLEAVAVWGRRPTAAAPRAAADRAGVPCLALEDGFLRSLRPGPAEPSLSYVLDREGVYYDATRPSDLERQIRARAADPAGAAAAAAPALHALRELGLSKYNLFAGPRAETAALAPLHPDPARNLLLVDQTAGDAAVTGALPPGGEGRAAFRDMLIAAAEAAPDARLILKTHPETAAGRRAGHFDDALLAGAAACAPAFAEALAAGRVIRLTAPVRPAALFARVGRVFALSSLLGLEALAAGLPVTCFGRAFYSGWGLTEDRAPPTGRRAPASLEALVAAAYADHCRWLDPDSRAPIPLETAVARLAARVERAAA